MTKMLGTISYMMETEADAELRGWPHSIMVRISGFHPEDRSSILRGVIFFLKNPFVVADK